MGALAVIDIQDSHQRRQVEVHHWPLRVGRALDNDVVLDDPHVAAHHLTLDEVGDALAIVLGDSVNGARAGSVWLARNARMPLPGNTPLYLGKSTLRIRRANDALPAEVPLARRSGGPVLAVLILAVLTVTVLDGWLDLVDSAFRWSALLLLLTMTSLVLVVWIGGWSLASKLFSRQADTSRHLRIALSLLLVYTLGNGMLMMTAFTFDWPLLDRYKSLFEFATFALLVYAHLRVVAPARPVWHALAVTLPTLAGIGVMLLLRLETSNSTADQYVMTAMYPPAFRLAPARPLDNFLADAVMIKAQLDAEAANPAEAEREYP